MIGFAEEVVAAGYTVVLPHLFGTDEAPADARGRIARSIAQVCVSREFTKLARARPPRSPAGCAAWPASCTASSAARASGALGMCFTGGFALAMMVDPSVVAPVLAQPSTPFCIGGPVPPTSTSAPATWPW